MIKNKLTLTILNYLGKLADRKPFSAVNYLVATTYKIILIKSLNLFCSKKIKFNARHSVMKSGHFNFAYSDLDLSASAEVLSNDEIEKIQKIYLKIKRVVPSIGEIEIYSSDERLRLETLFKNFGNQYEMLRSYRKVWWMQHSRNTATSEYHRLKAIRSIKFCLAKIDEKTEYSHFDNVSKISPFLQKYINEVFLEIKIPALANNNLTGSFVHCPYMGVRVYIGDELQNEGHLHLKKEEALKLLSITPVAYSGSTELERCIQNLRKEPKIFQLWSALTEMELLIFMAFSRGFEKKEPWMEKWMDCLEKAHFAVKISAKAHERY